MLRNPRAIKKLLVMDPNEAVQSGRRGSTAPRVPQGMKYCTSNEKYLRPTRWCNPRALPVVALANELGAYELSDYEFAEAAFWWIKTRIATEMVPMGSVSTTLKRGTGRAFT